MSEFLILDSFNALPLALFSLLWLALVVMAPKQDMDRRRMSRLLMVLAGTALVYTANHLALFVAGWLLSSWPLLEDVRMSRFARGSILLGATALTGSVALLVIQGGQSGAESAWLISSLSQASLTGGMWIFGLLMIAALQRQAIFPLHSWISDTVERGDLWTTMLVFNGHLGAVAVARIALPVLGEVSRPALTGMAALGFFTAVLTAVLALTDRRPRRLLAWVAASQASVILGGLASLNGTAITGALVHWIVICLATTALLAVLRLIEVRYGQAITGRDYLGLGARFPRLAVFFVVAGVALVGLPGTLGFCSEDLLLHGALEIHPSIGLAIPIATALNAISIFRLFGILFMGKLVDRSAVIPDAMPKERAPLTVFILLLVGFGLAPQLAINLRSVAAAKLERMENAHGTEAHALHTHRH